MNSVTMYIMRVSFIDCSNLEELQLVADNEGLPDKVMELARSKE
jgi:hypothetical protein